MITFKKQILNKVYWIVKEIFRILMLKEVQSCKLAFHAVGSEFETG